MAKFTQPERLLPANVKSIQKAVRNCIGFGAGQEFRIEGIRGLVLNVLPSGTATWYFHYDHQRGQARRRRKLKIGRLDATPLSTAQDRAAALRSQVRQGEDPARAKGVLKSSLSFQDLLEERLAHGDRLSPATEYDYRLLLKRDILPAIGHVPAALVTRQQVIDVIDSIAARGSRRRADTARIVISSIFAYGLDRGHISANPATGMRNRHTYLPRDVVASANDIRRLCLAMHQGEAAMATRIATILRLALLTGQRRTEIASARKDELDLESATPMLTIPRGRAKNRNMHRVPLSPQAARLFAAACAASEDSPFVFPGDRPGFPIASRSVSKAMERTRQKLGISDITVHDLRRTVGSYMARYGVPEDIRARILNHGGKRSGSVTDDVYGWYDYDAEKRAALCLWADALESIIAGSAAEIDSYVVRVGLQKGSATIRVD